MVSSLLGMISDMLLRQKNGQREDLYKKEMFRGRYKNFRVTMGRTWRQHTAIFFTVVLNFDRSTFFPRPSTNIFASEARNGEPTLVRISYMFSNLIDLFQAYVNIG